MATVSSTVPIILLALTLLGGLVLIPVGLPGLWVMLGAALLYWVSVPLGGIGIWTFGGAAALVVLAEVLEYTLAARYTRQYGGSSRASWGALLGGFVGAGLGVPVPVIGSVLGAFAGAFAGAWIGELTVHRDLRGDPARAATGAVVGRAVAAAAKSGIGVVIAIWLLAVVLVSRV